MNSDNVTSLRRPDGSRPALREVIPNAPTELPRCPLTGLVVWDKEAVMARTSEALYRHLGPRNTAGELANTLGRRESTAGARAILERRNTPALHDFVRLHHTPALGDPFTRAVLGLPDNPDLTRAIALLEQLENELRREGR